MLTFYCKLFGIITVNKFQQKTYFSKKYINYGATLDTQNEKKNWISKSVGWYHSFVAT